ncbi:MAG TPA: hypothetical protein VE999_01185 [Gemmataceae bacterium]|nr:hypothetical protein [Gemmataceae bacterium]
MRAERSVKNGNLAQRRQPDARIMPPVLIPYFRVLQVFRDHVAIPNGGHEEEHEHRPVEYLPHGQFLDGFNLAV